MYLILSDEIILNIKHVIGVFDLDKSTVSTRTREMLAVSQKSGQIVSVAPDELPRSFVLYEREGVVAVYLSKISATTLGRRLSNRLQ